LENDPKKENSCNYVICECGKKIILTTNLEEMSDAIAAHAAEHVKNESDEIKAEAEDSRIQDLLIIQVFKVISSTQNRPSSFTTKSTSP
jgi:hypothetical protein